MDINVEFARGVLFVRFYKDLTRSNTLSVKKILIDILNRGGIKYLVFNLNNCKVDKNVEIFRECHKIIKDNMGLMFLCGIDENAFKNYKFVSNELSALRKINTCLS